MEEGKVRRSNCSHSPAPCYAILILLAGAAAPAATGGPIKTVVIVVMENRSFDHMLGWMKRLNPEIDGVDGSEWNPTAAGDPNAARVYFKDGAHYVDPDPGHSFQAIREQIFGSNDTSALPAPMNGFVQQAASMSSNMTEAVMNGFLPEMVAVYQVLVSEFAVFDRWFASVPASTQPNRMYVHSATSHGATSNDAGMISEPSVWEKNSSDLFFQTRKKIAAYRRRFFSCIIMIAAALNAVLIPFNPAVFGSFLLRRM